MRTMQLTPSFDLVIAWHSFFHLPQEDQRNALKLFASLLKPKGLLLFTSGPDAGEVWGKNGGYDLYHASLSPQEYEQILQQNRLQIVMHRIEDPNCGDATVWLAQKW
ncbi:MAG: class I SAM-dependent methyltransferase [Legionella sp.]